MGVTVTDQAAGILAAIVRDRDARLGSHDTRIKIHHSFSTDRTRNATHSMPGVANRTGKTIVNMVRVSAEAGVVQHLDQVVTLGAHCIRARYAQIGIGKQVGDCSTRGRGLTELVPSFQNMRPP